MPLATPMPTATPQPTPPPADRWRWVLPDEDNALLLARAVSLPPTATSGVPASNAITESHSRRPAPTKALKSEKQKHVPVGVIWGVALGIVGAIAALFFLRFLCIRRRRRAAGPAPGSGKGKAGEAGRTAQPPAYPQAAPPYAYPPPPNPAGWSHFSADPREPGPGASPAQRQAYLAAEIRALEAQLAQGHGHGTRAGSGDLRQRIHELEQRKGSAWALGLE